MTIWKTAALAAVLVGTAALGENFAPEVHGQSTTPRAVAPRALEILSGRGSQIGVSIRDVDEEGTKGAKPNAPAGVVIEDVTADSPADKAGIKKGDVVLEFDGERVRSVRQFMRLVQETPAGRKVQASLLRDGQRTTVTLVTREGDGVRLLRDLENRRGLENFGYNFLLPAPARPTPPIPPTPPRAPFPPDFPDFPDFQSYVFRSSNTLGITVGNLSPQLAEYFGTKDGVLVTSVLEDSAAAKAGLKAGDVITSWKDTPVDTPAELRRGIQRLDDGEEFTIGVVRDKKALTLKGKVEPRRDRRQTSWSDLFR